MSDYKERLVAPDRRKLRKLKQYQSMSDDEFNEVMDKKELDILPVKAFEDRIERKLKRFEEDYDLSDMKFNDMESLRALAQAFIDLEDMEQITYNLKAEGISFDNLTLLDKISQLKTKLRGDINSLQDGLKISRKIRKSDEDESVVAFIDDLKSKAKKFYEEKMFYVTCPTCNMLLATTWFLWPDGNNKLVLTCNRKLETGDTCGTKVVVTSSELKEKKGTNSPDTFPDSLR